MLTGSRELVRLCVGGVGGTTLTTVAMETSLSFPDRFRRMDLGLCVHEGGVMELEPDCAAAVLEPDNMELEHGNVKLCWCIAGRLLLFRLRSTPLALPRKQTSLKGMSPLSVPLSSEMGESLIASS